MSSTNSKNYTNVAKLLSECVTAPKELLEAIHGRTVKRMGKKTLQSSVTTLVTETDIDLVRQYIEEVNLADKHMKECQDRLTAICENEFANLRTIPDVKEGSATSILAEIGTDMKMFITAAVLVFWCGLKPRNKESAGKIKSAGASMETKCSQPYMC